MQAAKNGRLYIVRGAGHMLTLDNRYIDECNEVLTFHLVSYLFFFI